MLATGVDLRDRDLHLERIGPVVRGNDGPCNAGLAVFG
jgi:hypothetical protein